MLKPMKLLSLNVPKWEWFFSTQCSQLVYTLFLTVLQYLDRISQKKLLTVDVTSSYELLSPSSYIN